MSDPAAPAIVTADLDCVGCGYNLRTRARDSRCPECGTEVQRSWPVFPDGPAIADALRPIRNGLLLFLFAAGKLVGLAVVWAYLGFGRLPTAHPMTAVIGYALAGLLSRTFLLQGFRLLGRTSLATKQGFAGDPAFLRLSAMTSTAVSVVLWTLAVFAVFEGSVVSAFLFGAGAEGAGLLHILHLQRFSARLALAAHADRLARRLRIVNRMVFYGFVSAAAAFLLPALLLRDGPRVVRMVFLLGDAVLAGVICLVVLVAVFVQAVLTQRLRTFLRRSAGDR